LQHSYTRACAGWLLSLAAHSVCEEDCNIIMRAASHGERVVGQLF